MKTNCPDCQAEVRFKPNTEPTRIWWEATCPVCKCEFSYDSNEIGGWEFEYPEIIVQEHGEGWAERELKRKKLARIESIKRWRDLRLNHPEKHQMAVIKAKLYRAWVRAMTPIPINKSNTIKVTRAVSFGSESVAQ